MLETQLAEISKKKKLADNREVFLEKKEFLTELIKEMKDESKAGNFEDTKCKISFSVYNSANYRQEEKFSISNNDLVLFFSNELLKKIDEVIQKIETELIA